MTTGSAGRAPTDPLAGVPPELAEELGVLRAMEPPPPPPLPELLDSHASDTGPTVGRLLARHWRLVALIGLVLVGFSATNQAGPELVSVAINHGIVEPHLFVVVECAIAFLACLALSALAQRAVARLGGRLAAQVSYELRVRVFGHLQRLGLDFYTAERGGVVLSRMTSDIENLQAFFRDGVAFVLEALLAMVAIAAVLAATNLELTVVLVCLTVPASVAASVWFQRRSATSFVAVRESIAAILADVSETLHGIRSVVLANRQARNVASHLRLVDRYVRAGADTAKAQGRYSGATQAIGYLAQAVLAWVGGELVMRHRLSLGALAAFILYVNRFTFPVQLIAQQWGLAQQASASTRKLRELLACPPSTPEPTNPVPLRITAGEVRFEGVDFSYLAGHPVLHQVSLTARPGETLAVVGPTGSGKSTITKLVARLYDPNRGRVLIDGVDIKEVALANLRRQVAWVPQEPFLFAGTVRDNLAIADPGAEDRRLWEVLEALGADEVVKRLPEGLDQHLSEGGRSLPAGERQLLCLARALVADPKVVLLDEATSNLDLRSEAQVEKALGQVLAGRTALVVAHRLSTAAKADRIVVIEAGRVAEIGTHTELLAAGGRYSAMWQAWTLAAAPGD